MMDKKIFFVLAAAFVALQFANVDSRIVAAPRNAIDDAVAHAKEVVAEWTAAVQDWLKTELAALQEEVNKLIAQGEDLIAQAKAQLDALVAQIQEELKEAAEEAAQLGTDITECTSGKEDEAVAIAEKAIAQAEDCVTGVVSEAEALLVTLVAQGSDALLLANSTLEAVNACLDGPVLLIVHCINKEIAAFQTSGEELVAELQEDADEANTLIGNLSDDVNQCVLPLASDTEAQLNAIAAEITTCITDTLNPTTTA